MTNTVPRPDIEGIVLHAGYGYEPSQTLAPLSVTRSPPFPQHRRKKVQMVNGVPRRIRVDLFIPAEKAISDAIAEVKKAGAHPLLTDVVIMLCNAQAVVADWHESEIAVQSELIQRLARENEAMREVCLMASALAATWDIIEPSGYLMRNTGDFVGIGKRLNAALASLPPTETEI